MEFLNSIDWGAVFFVPILIFTLLVGLWIALRYRTVVAANVVHIVQSKGATTSYGAGMETGNVYYNWPENFPKIGVESVELPVSNFELELEGYSAYDKDKVPFEVDVTAFFCITNTNIAARRISSIEELDNQLISITKGACRKVLASHNIEEIMVDRSTFGEQFTEEVKDEVASWGVTAVKNMELMDIRDSEESQVISNIMAKRSSAIEMESRIKVAENMRDAETKEIEAKKQVNLKQQDAEREVGERTAEKTKAIGIADEQALQEIKIQQKVTTEKDMDVKKVETVRAASIQKEAEVVAANQNKETTVIQATGELEAKKMEAEGVRVSGQADADAEQAMQLAPVNAQLELAKGIGENANYMHYLIGIKAIDGEVEVGTAKAKALTEADVKVISNAGDASTGLTSAMDIFSPKGGTSVGAFLEALGQTPQGKELLEGVATLLKGQKEDSSDTVNFDTSQL